MTDLKLCVDLVDFELMHVTVVMQVLNKRTDENDAIYDSDNQPNERKKTDFSQFLESDGGVRMTLTEANAFIKALSLSTGIEITTPFRERKTKSQATSLAPAPAPQQNNEPPQAANTQSSPAAAIAAATSATPAAPAAAAGTTPAYGQATSAAPHFNQAAAGAMAPREETAKGIAERFSVGSSE